MTAVTNDRVPQCFLFLQGPHGRFFTRLGEELTRRGHRVRRINLNGGDRATWPGGDDYHGVERGWPRHVARYIARHSVTDLILFGDGRPAHAAAIEHARAAGVRVHVFEEGYIRPDWITLERHGVNGYSRLPRDPAWYLCEARHLSPVPEHPAIPSFATGRGWAAFFYYAEVALQFWRFPFHRSHRDRNPVWEGATFLRRFRHRSEEQARSAAALARIGTAPFFLFPLQLNSDYQIRVHSPFGTLNRAIDMVLESFARAAPRVAHLLIKEHPLDSGLNRWREVVVARAAAFGVADRVGFVEAGDLLALVAASQGMVVVNSTSGTLALAAGKPVKALGNPVYDMSGLTDQQPLDGFWVEPRPPDTAVYEAFRRVLVDRVLIHGAFLSDAGIELLLSECARRLIAEHAERDPERGDQESEEREQRGEHLFGGDRAHADRVAAAQIDVVQAASGARHPF